MGWYYNSYPQRKSAAEIKADAKRNIKKDYHPVVVEGRRIAETWWGDAWCRNIDFYADQMNRLSRGKNFALMAGRSPPRSRGQGRSLTMSQ